MNRLSTAAGLGIVALAMTAVASPAAHAAAPPTPSTAGAQATASPLPPTAAPTPTATAQPTAAPTPTASTQPTGTPPAPTRPTILARGDIAFLGGDPWRPSGELKVAVTNTGARPAQAWFLLRLPSGVKLDSPGKCAATGSAGQAWICGGALLPAGGSRFDKLTIRSVAGEPVWGVTAWGSVAGRDATGLTDRPDDFRINWPDRTSLRLRATSGPVVNGTATVRVRVSNTGTFDIGGYSLNIVTPDGVRVTSPGCSTSGRMNGVGCEIVRNGGLKDGATDSFDVRLAVTGAPKTVRLYLAPTNRYTNKDTSVTLRLAAESGAGAGAAASPDSTAPAGGPELPLTGTPTTLIALVGAALVALGAGLLVLRRRLAAA
ncbi:LPXTG cell wall anchor domain-containing protein [Micromonospora sp. NPDC000089]|uniref:LPXTG cell wall anchor domain-containing protein n=1 Tax=unclassified Micromonospora TaxID=2617518 RepID=UPI0036886C45